MNRIIAIFFAVCVFCTPIVKAEENRAQVALLSSFVFGEKNAVGDVSPGGVLEGYVRLYKWFGAGMHFNFNRLMDFNNNWYRVGVFGDFNFSDEEAHLLPFVGAGIADSIYNGNQGLTFTGRAGLRYQLIDHLVIQTLGEYSYSMGLGIQTQNHPDFSAGDFQLGLGYSF